MDLWNPATFGADLSTVLAGHSDLVRDYYREDRRLMNEHLNSDPYRSLEPNPHSGHYLALREQTVTPVLSTRRIRVWHYTRLLDEEVALMREQLIPSTRSSLWQRMELVVELGVLTRQEAQTVYNQSVFNSASQAKARSGLFWTTTIPKPATCSAAAPLLESWGGEAAYWWAKPPLSSKLRTIGSSRIVEIETTVGEANASLVSDTAIRAWARKLGLPVTVPGGDLQIAARLDSARVMRVHSAGEKRFYQVGKAYPDGCSQLTGVTDNN